MERTVNVKKRPKQSRSDSRKQAALRAGASDLYPTSITEHFKVLDEIPPFAKENEVLSGRLKEIAVAYKKQSQIFSLGDVQTENDVDSMALLKQMMNQAIKQSGKKKRGRGYDDPVLSDLSLNLWILGGRHTYEILHDNLPWYICFPHRGSSKVG